MKTTILSFAAAGCLAVPFTSGAAELTPNRYEPLPAEAIRAEGWLGLQLEQMTEGILGRLEEKSEYLTPNNSWLKRDGDNGWEEQAYWLRSFALVAVQTRNARMLKTTEKWMNAMAANADPDGWYGPQELKAGTNKYGVVISDVWPHMVMNEAVLTWWEHTGDRRWLDMLHRFLTWCQAQPDTRLIPSWDVIATAPEVRKWWGNWMWHIQLARAGDMLPSIYRVYDATGDKNLLKLAHRVYMKRERAKLFLNGHNVNFSQLFNYGTVFGRQSRDPADLGYADHWYDLHLLAWGAMIPRQGFAADENFRLGCYDPRYGTETCTWAEFVRSFSLLGAQTGDTKWADRAEDVVFNWCPISYTPGWKELHYITAGNQVSLDARTDHDYQNGAPMAPYSSTFYRCCRHNAALALPEFTRHLTLRDGADGLVFWTYAPHAGKAKVGSREVTWKMTTHYPFDGRIDLAVTGAEGLKLRYRVPGWAKRNPGAVETLAPSADGKWTLSFESEPRFKSVVRTGAVMVEKGPLTYSVAIKPEVRRIKTPKFDRKDGEADFKYFERETPKPGDDVMVEVVPAKGERWNFAVDTSVKPAWRPLAWHDDCFTFANAPCEMTVAARELKEWTAQDAQPAELQESPAFTTAPVEKVRFIPMCCARSHVTVLPRATDDAEIGIRWQRVPEKTLRKDRKKIFRQ